MARNDVSAHRAIISAFKGRRFFCCHIDDAEGAYLKVLLDEIFGRSNYETTFYIQVRYLKKTLKLDMAYHKKWNNCTYTEKAEFLNR